MKYVNKMNDLVKEKYFEQIVSFFQKFQWLYRIPMTRILCNNSLNLFPADWIEALKNLNNHDLNDFVVNGTVQNHWPESLKCFVHDCHKFNKLPNITTSLPIVKLPPEFTKNLSKKKQHEIFHLTQLIHEHCLLTKISLIIDVGAGLGHICQLLNYLYGYQVLGLESNSQNVRTAKIRQKLLFPHSLSSVKFRCCHITIESIKNIELIIEQEFKKIESICLIGLHACGDLSVFMSNIFVEMKLAKLLIVVPCCYHKLSFVDTNKSYKSCMQNEYFKYFPLSQTLKNVVKRLKIDIGQFLTRPFLRLACQEKSERWFNMVEEAHRKHSFYVLARAVLELYSTQNELELKKIVRKGTRKSQCSNFENYLEDCTNRYQYEKKIIYFGKVQINSISWNQRIKTEILALWKNNVEKQQIIELYTALQLLLQNVAESFVLADRVCFLNEYNFKTNILLPMDKILSPRSYAIVSNKIIQ